MSFARRVFFWSGVYGIIVLVPMYFLEGKLSRDFPPGTNHPEQYYGFLGVALAWQFAFLLIARDVSRYRPLMVPAIAEKLLAGGAALWLFIADRIGVGLLVPFIVDIFIGVLFIISYLRTSESSS